MNDDIDSPDKIAAAIQRLEELKAARAEGRPEAGTAYDRVERVFADPATNEIIQRQAEAQARIAKAPRKAKPRATKSQKATPPIPTRFYVITDKARGGHPGAVSEDHYYIVKGEWAFLTDVNGVELGQSRKHFGNPLYVARAMVRDKLNARAPGPNHDPIRYPATGWR